METLHIFDFIAAFIGLVYIYLEYKASIWLWLVGMIMPAIDIYVYWEAGLYADSGMAVYYTLAAIYGFVAWKMPRKTKNKPAQEVKISHIKKRETINATLAFAALWAVIYYILITFSNSTIPITDAFVNALSIVALWALAKKYIEQWLIWIVVDVVFTILAFHKGLIFKPSLYALYVIIAIFGYRKWLKTYREEKGKWDKTNNIMNVFNAKRRR